MPKKKQRPETERERLRRVLREIEPSLTKAGLTVEEVADHLAIAPGNLYEAYGFSTALIRSALAELPPKHRRLAAKLRTVASFAEREHLLRPVAIAELELLAAKSVDAARSFSRRRGSQTGASDIFRLVIRERWETLARARTGKPLHALGARAYSLACEDGEIDPKYFEQLIARDTRRFPERRTRIERAVLDLRAASQTPQKSPRKL